jgi:hypothetical protein
MIGRMSEYTPVKIALTKSQSHMTQAGNLGMKAASNSDAKV